MSEKLRDPRERRWAQVHVIWAVLFALFYIYSPVNIYLWVTVRYSYVLLSIPLMVGLYYYHRRLEGGMEQRLVTAYVVWFFLTRLLNGDLWLQTQLEFDMVCELAVCSVLLPVGGLLNEQGRRRMLSLLTLGMGVYFLPLGCVGVYAYIARKMIYNPITGATIAGIPYSWFFNQLNVTDLSANISSFLFLLTFLVMVSQFFRCKNVLWRIPMVLTMLVSYLIMVFTTSRNVMFCFAGCLAMLVILLVRKHFHLRKLWVQGLVMALIVAVVCPLTVKSFDWTLAAASKLINYTGTVQLPEHYAAQTEGTADEWVFDITDNRDLGESLNTMSDRDVVFKGAFLTVAEEPARLVRGSLFEHVMDVINPHLTIPYDHMHNYLLQVLGLTGLPGLLLVLAFTALMVWRLILVFFSEDPRLDLSVKTLTLPLTAYFVYGMLEIPIFGFTDSRAYPFFLLAGAFLAWSYEVYPPRAGQWKLMKKQGADDAAQ